jgi:predicted ATPase
MIKQIRIQNFRSIADQTIELSNLTVLIGRSGTGKSSFVRAVRFLRDCLHARRIGFESFGGKHHVLHADHQTASLAYDVKFSIPGFDEEFSYLLHFLPKQEKITEQLAIGGKTLFHHSDRKWVVAPAVTPVPGITGIMLGAIPGLQESTFAYVALRSGIGCYDFSGDVLTGDGKKGHPVDGGFADHGDNYILIANQILSDLQKAAQWKKIAKGMRAVNRAVANLVPNVPTPDRIDVGLQLNGRVLTFDVRQESEGFRRYLAHLLALYQTPSKQTLIFEHPEAGLHPGALESLAEEFKDCPEEGRGQVILTTHSPQLLHYFPVKSIRVVDIDHQQTRIGPLAPEQLKAVEERLLLPDELLTVDPARLEGQLNEVPG